MIAPQRSSWGEPGPEANFVNLRRLGWVRFIILVLEGLALAALLLVKLPLPVAILLPLLSANLVLIFLTALTVLKPRPVSSTELCWQLLLDVLLQSILLFFSGGYTNPLVFVYLIYISFAAALLPVMASWTITVLAISCYSAMMHWYQPLPGMGADHVMGGMVALHLVGMWIMFTLSALLINLFVGRMMLTLREQRAAINKARERQLRDERILAVATVTAGAAHELGTPLATMAVVLDDLIFDYQDDQELVDQVSLLKGQVGECKKRLARLVNASQAHEGEPLPVDLLVYQVLDEWLLLRPEVRPVYVAPEWSVVPQILADSALPMALINLLDNAADACPDQIEINLEKNVQQVIIQIRDRGPGIPVTLVAQLGTLFYSSKGKGGHGLGVQLSQATIERCGGTVQLFNQAGGGVLTEVCLPIHQEGNYGSVTPG